MDGKLLLRECDSVYNGPETDSRMRKWGLIEHYYEYKYTQHDAIFNAAELEAKYKSLISRDKIKEPNFLQDKLGLDNKQLDLELILEKEEIKVFEMEIIDRFQYAIGNQYNLYRIYRFPPKKNKNT